MLNIDNNIGPAIVVNGGGDSVSVTPVTLNFDLTGTGGVISIDNEAFSGHYNFSGTTKTVDLGTQSHVFYQNLGTTSTDLEIVGTIASDSSGGGMIKEGDGTIKFQQTAPAVETFTGPIEIQEGSIKLTGTSTSNNQLNGENAVLIDGGNFNPNGAGAGTGDVTVASLTATAGSITDNAANYIFAPSYNFNIIAGQNFTVQSSLGDESGGIVNGSPGVGTSAVAITGPGNVTFSGTSNTYTAGTTVSGGTLVANMNASGNPISTGSVAINGSSLNLDPNVAAGSGTAISYGLANLSASTQLKYGGGNTLNIKQGNETSLTVTIGPASPSGSVLNRVNNGTLVIAPDLGTSSLGLPGGTEFVFVNGMAATNVSSIPPLLEQIMIPTPPVISSVTARRTGLPWRRILVPPTSTLRALGDLQCRHRKQHQCPFRIRDGVGSERRSADRRHRWTHADRGKRQPVRPV